MPRSMPIHLRIARLVTDLQRSVEQYTRGLGLVQMDSFVDHQGFDGVMLGMPDCNYHLELTHCRAHPIRPQSTPEDLLVFYQPDSVAFHSRCASMLDAGFAEVELFNPYWGQVGKTFCDRDGYRVVIQNAAWHN
jgi:hypothetical protein